MATTTINGKSYDITTPGIYVSGTPGTSSFDIVQSSAVGGAGMDYRAVSKDEALRLAQQHASVLGSSDQYSGKPSGDPNAFLAKVNAELARTLEPNIIEAPDPSNPNQMVSNISLSRYQQMFGNESAVAAGTLQKVPIGSGFGYIPVGSPAAMASLPVSKTLGAMGGETTPPADNFGTGPEADRTRAILAAGQKMIDIPPMNTTGNLQMGQASNTPPTTSGGNATATYLTGIQSSLDTLSKNLNDAYQKQSDDAKTKADVAQKQIDEIDKQQRFVLGDKDILTKPFRDELTAAQKEKYKFDENFFANQNAVSEMQTLMTSTNAEISAAEGQTGLTAIMSPRIAKLKENAIARVGVLKALVDIRNNQIATAKWSIDTSINAMNDDRKDRLSYYKDLLDFYGKQKDIEGNKLIVLTKDQKSYVDAQIKITSDQLDSAQKTVEYVKQLMSNPTSAGILQNAGVTLNDSVEQINTKVGKAVYQQEISKQSEDMANSGFQAIPFPNADPRSKQEGAVTVQDSRGAQHVYFKKPSATLPTQKEDTASMNGALKGKAGSDGYISPNDYAFAKSQWIAGGYTGQNFDDTFSGFRNPDNLNYALTL